MTNYVVKQRKSGKTWCIYLADYDVVVAEFEPGCQRDARNLAARLAAADALVEILVSIADDQCCLTPGCSEDDPMCKPMNARAALRRYREVVK